MTYLWTWTFSPILLVVNSCLRIYHALDRLDRLILLWQCKASTAELGKLSIGVLVRICTLVEQPTSQLFDCPLVHPHRLNISSGYRSSLIPPNCPTKPRETLHFAACVVGGFPGRLIHIPHARPLQFIETWSNPLGTPRSMAGA